MSTKVVGQRVASKGGLEQADGFLRLVIALRGKRRFIPRGVYRFRSFEEAAEWSIKMMSSSGA